MWILRALVCSWRIGVGRISHIHSKLTLIIILIATTLHMVGHNARLFIWYLSIFNTYIESSLLQLVALRLYLSIIVFISAFYSLSVSNLTSIVASSNIFERYILLLVPLLLLLMYTLVGALNEGCHLSLTLFIWIIKTIEGVSSW